MKNALFTLAAILVSTIGLAQTTTENFIKTTTYKVETQDAIDNANTNIALTENEKIEQVNYFDGLGRAKQSVSVRAGGNQEDVISHFEYDAFGRQVKDYLPYANITTQGGAIQLNPLDELSAFYNKEKYENTLNPFSEKSIEPSPLNRLLEQGAPGADWALDNEIDADHTIKFDYQTNVADEVKLLEANFILPSTYTSNEQVYYTYHELTELVYSGTYAEGKLYKTITKDENWKPNQTNEKDYTTEEFKDKQGRVILKRTYNDGLPYDTQYVYDDFGNLVFVLSPKGSDTLLTQNVLTDFNQTIDGQNIVSVYSSSTTTGNVSVNLTGNQLLVNFNVSFNSPSYLKYGAIIQLDQPLPNMEIGILSAGENNYIISIQDGYLHLFGDGFGEVSNLTGSLTTNVPEYGVDKNVIAELGYQYRYDFRNRLIAKKVPGKGWEYIVYTKLDQPHYTQDANLRENNSWLFTVYDEFGRVAYTGMDTNNTQVRDGMHDSVHTGPGNGAATTRSATPITQGGGTMYYTIGPFLSSLNFEVLHTVNYYDDYAFDVDGIYVPSNVFGKTISYDTKSLATGSKIRVLGTDDWITTVTYYDDKRRPIYIASKNDYLETIDYSLTEYDFMGNILRTESIHTKTGNEQVNIQNEYTYDHVNRLLKNEQRTNMLEFTDLVGIEIVDGNTLTKTDPGNSWDTGFASTGKIITDGYISFRADHYFDSNTMIGLSEQNNGDSYGTIQYGLYANKGKIYIYEGDGVSTAPQVYAGSSGNNGLYTNQDVLSIKRVNGVISYWRNNDLIYTSTAPNTNPLIIDGTIYREGNSIYNLQLYNDHQELIVKNTYDDLGQLESKNVGNIEATPLQTVDYTYNVRGWLKNINDIDNLGSDLFSFRINYNNTQTNGFYSQPLYNGNISETIWHTVNDENHIESRSYDYEYDHLNRLKNAGYMVELAILSYFSQQNKYTVHDINYDKNGNILTLNRRGGFNEPIYLDRLAYSYDGNKLMAVADSESINIGFADGNTTGDDYTYDANGNMIQDLNKNISTISYNHLNLPRSVIFGGNGLLDKIDYIYDATGSKLEKIVTDNANGTGYSPKVTQYAEGFVYEKSFSGPCYGCPNPEIASVTILKFFSHAEGYVNPDGNGGYNYVYQYKDHLGNIRLSYSDQDGNGLIDSTTEILEENNYYPFGLKHKGYNNVINGTDHKYGFGGMEEQDELGLAWIDITARNYDPAIGRWMNLDPLAEQMRRHSPYNYAFNNPIYFMDPDGMAPVGSQEDPIFDDDGNVIGYEVEEGQGPSQIAEDLNNLGVYSEDLNFLDIVNLNKDKFTNVENKKDINDEEYTKLNLNKGDVIDVPSEKSGGNLIIPNNSSVAESIPGEEQFGDYERTGMTKEEKLELILAVADLILPDPVDVGIGKLKDVTSPKSSRSNTRSAQRSSETSLSRSSNPNSSSRKPNSWNQFLKANRGKYSGEGWQQKAAADYRKLKAGQ